jgi:poly-gamma-glutamate synthase PgsB/CapB
LSVESACLLKPHLLVITNVRLDHLDLMGSTKSEIAGVLASAIRPNCTVFVPEGESCPEFSERAGKVDANFIPVAKRLEESDFEFPENLRLAMAVSESVGLIKEIALHGMRGARPDFGSLRLWGASFGTPPRNFVLANGFAANDPESSLAVLARIKTRVPCRAKEMIGLFNLREDRGDRSLQWLQALQTEPWSGFDEIVFAGYYPHALNLKRRLGGRTKARVRALPERNPEALMARIVPEPGKDVLVLGLGNIQGLGQAVVEYWDKVGIPYGY